MLQRWELRLSVHLMLLSCSIAALAPEGVLPSSIAILLALVGAVSLAAAVVAVVLQVITGAARVPSPARQHTHFRSRAHGLHFSEGSAQPRAPTDARRAPRLHLAT